jgi:hypothetical protein
MSSGVSWDDESGKNVFLPQLERFILELQLELIFCCRRGRIEMLTFSQWCRRDEMRREWRFRVNQIGDCDCCAVESINDWIKELKGLCSVESFKESREIAADHRDCSSTTRNKHSKSILTILQQSFSSPSLDLLLQLYNRHPRMNYAVTVTVGTANRAIVCITARRASIWDRANKIFL